MLWSIYSTAVASQKGVRGGTVKGRELYIRAEIILQCDFEKETVAFANVFGLI